MSQDKDTTAPLDERADDLAKEIVSIAASEDLGDLRVDMIINASAKTLLGDVGLPAPLRVAVAHGVIIRLGGAIETLSDELRAVSS